MYVVFEEFYKELFESLSIAIEDASYGRVFHTYNLVKYCKDKRYVVKFKLSNCMMEYHCNKFE